VMAGGKFANGAMTGAFSRMFNDLQLNAKVGNKEFGMSFGEQGVSGCGTVGGTTVCSSSDGLSASSKQGRYSTGASESGNWETGSHTIKGPLGTSATIDQPTSGDDSIEGSLKVDIGTKVLKLQMQYDFEARNPINIIENSNLGQTVKAWSKGSCRDGC